MLLALLVVFSAQSPKPLLVRAHAHNDYEHTRPLLDALDQGFCSIEADIYLVDGELRVATIATISAPAERSKPST